MLLEPEPSTEFSPYVDTGGKGMFLRPSLYDERSRCSTASSKVVERESWIQWFCGLKGHEMFCHVDRSFIEESFNLNGLKQETGIMDMEQCVDIILDNVHPHEPVDSKMIQNVCTLYGLIHARYIVTEEGLEKMHHKFMSKDFGICPQSQCEEQQVLPVGLSDEMGMDSTRIFCPKCQCIYPPPPIGLVDGASFGKTFAHLFFLTYPKCRPVEEKIIKSSYVPRVFGFRVQRNSQTSQEDSYSLTKFSSPLAEITNVSNQLDVNEGKMNNSDSRSSHKEECGSNSPLGVAGYESPKLMHQSDALPETEKIMDNLDDKFRMLRDMWADDIDCLAEEATIGSTGSSESEDLDELLTSPTKTLDLQRNRHLSQGMNVYNPIDLSSSGPLTSRGSFKYSTLDDVVLADTNPLNGYSFLDPLYQYPSFTIYEEDENDLEETEDETSEAEKTLPLRAHECNTDVQTKIDGKQEGGGTKIQAEFADSKPDFLQGELYKNSTESSPSDDVLGSTILKENENPIVEVDKTVTKLHDLEPDHPRLDLCLHLNANAIPFQDEEDEEDEELKLIEELNKIAKSTSSECSHDQPKEIEPRALSRSSYMCSPNILSKLKKRDEMKAKFERQLHKIKRWQKDGHSMVQEVTATENMDDISDLTDPI